MAVVAPITQVLVQIKSVDSKVEVLLKDKMPFEKPDQQDFRDADTKFFDSFAYNRELQLFKDTREALRDYTYVGNTPTYFKAGQTLNKNIFDFQDNHCKLKGE